MRPIDGEEYMKLLKEQYLHHKAMGNNQISKAWQGAMQLLYDMPTLTPPNEWVSVEERLPEVGQEVLVYWRNTSQKAEHFELTHYDGDHWFLLDNTDRPWIVVVAWMTLPAPPDRRPPERQEDT